jgi:hypothetical protein
MDLGLTYTHQDVFGLCDEFFGSRELSMEENIKFARNAFVNTNAYTYRWYFFCHSEPFSQLTNTQISQADVDHLKESFGLGSLFITCLASKPTSKFNLIE